MTSPCDDESYTMLISDALRGDVNNVRSFLEDHNVSVDDIFHECPLLILASSMGHIELVEWLLHQGANHRLYDDENRTAFFLAASGGFRDLAEVLFEQGDIDVDDVDIYGRTALDWVRQYWKFVPTESEKYKAIDATIEWLLYQGASLPMMAQEVAGSRSLTSSEPLAYFPRQERPRTESALCMMYTKARQLPHSAPTLDWKPHKQTSFPFSAPGSLDESRYGSTVHAFDERLDIDGEESDGGNALEEEDLIPREGEDELLPLPTDPMLHPKEKFGCITNCVDLVVRTWRNAGFGLPGLGPLPFVGI